MIENFFYNLNDLPQKILSLTFYKNSVYIQVDKQTFINFCEEKKLTVNFYESTNTYFVIYKNVKIEYYKDNFSIRFSIFDCIEKYNKVKKIMEKYKIKNFKFLFLYSTHITITTYEKIKELNYEKSENLFCSKIDDFHFYVDIEEKEEKENTNYLEVLKNERD